MAQEWMLKAVLMANSAGLVSALKDVNKIAKTTRKYLLDVGKSAGNLSGKVGLPFAALSGVLGGFSLAGIKGALSGFAEMGETVKRGSIQAGMSVQEYQRMKYVAEQAGTSVEALGTNLGKLNQRTGDAANGKNKSVAALYKQLGVSMRDANGQVRRGVDLLPELADAFKRNTNESTRTRMGMALFGRSYAEILPMLVEGSKGITESLQRMEGLKGVFDDDEIEKAKKLGDSFKDLNMVFKGFQMTIAKELAPEVNSIVKQLTAWWVANKKLVSVEVAKMARDLGEWIKTIDFKAIIAGVQDFCSSLGNLVDKIGGAKNALIGLFIFMNLGAINAFVGLIGSIGRLIWWLGSLAVKAIPKAIGALGEYTVAAKAAETATGGAITKGKALLGVFGQLALAAAPLAAMWGVKEWAEDTSHDQERVGVMKGWSDRIAGVMPDWMGDPSKGSRERWEARRADLVTGGARGRVDGQVNINIAGLPQGSTVTQSTTGNLPLNLAAGYRGDLVGAW